MRFRYLIVGTRRLQWGRSSDKMPRVCQVSYLCRRSYGPISGSFVLARNVRYGYYLLQREVRQGSFVAEIPTATCPKSKSRKQFVCSLLTTCPAGACHFQLALSFQSSQASLDEPASLNLEMIRRRPQALGLPLAVFVNVFSHLASCSLSHSSPN